jgi:hypothetical protein
MKTKLPDVCEQLIQLLKDGNTAKTACGLAGIDEATFYRWMERGQKEQSGQFCEFCKSVKKAKAEAQAYHVSVIKKASQESWQASAWYLERTDPDNWGHRERHSVDATYSGTTIIKHVDVGGRDDE